MNPRYDDSPEDPDLALARRLASGFSPEEQSPDAGEDPVLSALAVYRASRPAPVVDEGRAGRLWIEIQRATRAVPHRPAVKPRGVMRLVRLPWVQLAVAASILFFVVWAVRGPKPTWNEVASAGSSTMVFRSPDGSSITLRPNSRLDAYGRDGRTYRISGEAYFDVVHDAARPFVVEGAGAEVTVLGTRFDLSTWGGRAEVFLESGRIRLRALHSGAAVDLVPGQAAAVSDSLHVEAGSSEQALDWMSGSLVFASRSAGVIAAEMAHHFGTDISIPDPVASEMLTGRVLLSDLEGALADLGIVLGGRFVSTDQGGYRFER